MKQILQNLKSGETLLEEVPSPVVGPGKLRIQTRLSLISAGTERMLVDFGRASYLDKARQQPDKVRQVLGKIGTDGLAATAKTVSARLDEPQPLGYSNVGVVTHVGDGVRGFQVGDRVVSNGRHAEIVCVPRNLCAPIPDGVPDEQAAFTVVGSIGLQGIRLLQPTLGESVIVYGLGLIGLLSAQLLRAHGCRVLGVDLSPERVALAESLGIRAIGLDSGTAVVAAARDFGGPDGADGVLITAATKSDELMHNAAAMCRKRGRIVLVGVTGLNLSRADFYEKEISFQVSCSYGPGRYDPSYEDRGHDYPIGFVRWTEQRNFEAVLECMRSGQVQTAPLISARLPLVEAPAAYERVVAGDVVTVLLDYPDPPELDARSVELRSHRPVQGTARPGLGVGVVGAGNFARARVLPALADAGVSLVSIASRSGLSSASSARKFGFARNTNDVASVLDDDDVDAVFVLTRHDSHGPLVLQALDRRKHVFVEKPLTLREEELDEIVARMDEVGVGPDRPDGLRVMVGFNRRFSPHVVEMRRALRGRHQPVTAIYTANAGAIPPDHWTQDPEVGGGRILGEACHFIDLLRHLVDEPITEVHAVAMGREPEVATPEDKMSITLVFADGSHGTVHYFANGTKAFPKERVEVFAGEQILQLDNFRKLKIYRQEAFRPPKLPKLGDLSRGQDKGHRAGFLAFVDSIRSGGPPPIPFDEIVNSTRATFAALESARTGRRISLP